jgi:hypothetical protein
MSHKRHVRSLYSADASDRAAPDQRPRKHVAVRQSRTSTSARSSSPETLFPLPLVRTKNIHGTSNASTSQRDLLMITKQTNLAIQALNTLHYNFPNDTNMNTISSSPLSSARDRLMTNIRQSAQSHYYKCQSADPSGTDCLLESALRLVDTSSPFVRVDDTALSTPTPVPYIDVSRHQSLPHVATPMIYGPSPAISPIICDRVALPTHLANLPILDHLPERHRLLYAEENPVLVMTQYEHGQRMKRWIADGRPLPSMLVHGERSEYIKLVKRMLSIGMLSLTDCPREVNGIFTVKKDDQTDRLIIDARYANTWFMEPPKTSLPTPAHVTQLQLAPDEQLLMGKADISNYYHHLRLPTWLWPFLALPSVAAWEIGVTDVHPDCLVWPCCTTLPMGWSHSVRIAQLIHENILYQPHGNIPPALRREDNILHIQRPDIDRPLHALYVDDSIVFGLASDPVGAKEQYDRMLRAYAAVGLPVKESKCIRPDAVRTVTALGMDVNGVDGTVSISAERHHKMILATVHLLWKKNVTGHALSVVIGLWTWNLLLRRPALSALKNCYAFVRTNGWSSADLWPCVRRELIVLIGLAPLLHSSLHHQWWSSTVASDASTLKAGVVATAYVEDLMLRLWPSTCVSWLVSASDELITDGERHIVEPLDDALAVTPLAAPMTLKTDYRWSEIISYTWRNTDEHINALELRAAILACRWILSHPSSARKRVMLVIDSAVVYYVMRKGRSSSSPLLAVYRRLSSLLLASGLNITPIWVPSAANPADEASRRPDYDVSSDGL